MTREKETEKDETFLFGGGRWMILLFIVFAYKFNRFVSLHKSVHIRTKQNVKKAYNRSTLYTIYLGFFLIEKKMTINLKMHLEYIMKNDCIP